MIITMFQETLQQISSYQVVQFFDAVVFLNPCWARHYSRDGQSLGKLMVTCRTTAKMIDQGTSQNKTNNSNPTTKNPR